MSNPDNDELRSEYTTEALGQGVRGKHYAAYQESTNVVVLSPDVAKAFPTADAVNEALREILAQRTQQSEGD